MFGQIWVQNYDPLGSVWLSALIALIPVIFFLITLGVLRWKAHVAGFSTALLAGVLAVLVFNMPVGKTVVAAINGFLYGMWPIAWIIIAAVFLYKLSVNSGQFDIIRDSILHITADQRILVILIGFCFGAFLEGAAGFGAPVAITAALLAGIGLHPLYAAGLCLIANTAPVAFGALGIPIITAGEVAGLDPFLIGRMAGHQLPFLAVIVPLFLVVLMDGKRGLKEVWPAALVAGISFAVTQWLTAAYLGPQLPDITSALVALAVTAIFLRFWQPGHVLTVEEAQREAGEEVSASAMQDLKDHSVGEMARAWSPFMLLIVFVIIWTNDGFKSLFAEGGPMSWSVFLIEMPGLHQLVQQSEPIGDALVNAVFKFDIISSTGTAIFFAAVATIFVYAMKPKQALDTFVETLNEMKWSILNIGFVLAFAYIMNFSGMASTMAISLAETGWLFPFLSPVIGWIGVFLTGSDTSSNALFCNLQRITAEQVFAGTDVVDKIPILTVAANTTGGVTGKMISPQSISIACAAVGMVGRESDLLRFTFKWSLVFLAFISILTGLQAYVLTGMIPG